MSPDSSGMGLVYSRRQEDVVNQYIAEVSNDLTSWVVDDMVASQMTVRDVGGGLEECFLDVSIPTAPHSGTLFYRIRVEP